MVQNTDNSTKEVSLVQNALNPIKALLPNLIPIAIIYAPVHSLISSFIAFAAGVVIVDNKDFFNSQDNQKEKTQNFFEKIGNSLYKTLPALIPLTFMCQTSLPFSVIAAPTVLVSYGSYKAVSYLVKNYVINTRNKKDKSPSVQQKEIECIKSIDVGQENSVQIIAQTQEVHYIKEQLKISSSDKSQNNNSQKKDLNQSSNELSKK